MIIRIEKHVHTVHSHTDRKIVKLNSSIKVRLKDQIEKLPIIKKKTDIQTNKSNRIAET